MAVPMVMPKIPITVITMCTGRALTSSIIPLSSARWGIRRKLSGRLGFIHLVSQTSTKKYKPALPVWKRLPMPGLRPIHAYTGEGRRTILCSTVMCLVFMRTIILQEFMEDSSTLALAAGKYGQRWESISGQKTSGAMCWDTNRLYPGWWGDTIAFIIPGNMVAPMRDCFWNRYLKRVILVLQPVLW